jgi:hypothetical protein
MNSLEKLRVYHEILDAMFSSVVKLQSKGSVPFSFTYRGKHYDMNLKVFLIFIIGDTKRHDKLCALHNETGTRGGAIAVMYVRGVRIYAHGYFSLLNYLFPVFLFRSNPGVRHIRKLFVSVLFFDSE